jgi:malate dehydrogenase (quinone)
MSATLGVLLQELEPTWDIRVYERLDELGVESSGPWNNAGTGHAALCELNYTPEKADGSIDVAKAVTVNEQFQVSRQLWAFLVENGRIPAPDAFIHATPHMSFVWGEENVAYLRRRYEALEGHPLFTGMEFSDDPEVIRRWAPLLLQGRDLSVPIAATRSEAGSDVDFGRLTNLLMDSLTHQGATLELGTEVRKVKRSPEGHWTVTGRRKGGERLTVDARFVFVGAGGFALRLLQGSGIDEVKGFGGFPVSGEFLRTTNQTLVAQHHAKVYGKAAVGAPPMSVPHLDTRMVEGSSSLMFGPYAGFSPRFLKFGSFFDLFKSIRLHNLWPMVRAGLRNLDLTLYLIQQLIARPKTKFKDLQDFFPDADPRDWEKLVAGQRVQVIRPDGVLQFGTEVITSSDGSIAGLLGASPGASTAAPIMLEVLERCFADRWASWKPALEEMVPSHGAPLSTDPAKAHDVMSRTATTLGLTPPAAPREAATA